MVTVWIPKETILMYKRPGKFLPTSTIENAVRSWCKQKSHFGDMRINLQNALLSSMLCFTFFVVYITFNGSTHLKITNRTISYIQERKNSGAYDIMYFFLVRSLKKLYRYYVLRLAPERGNNLFTCMFEYLFNSIGV